MSTTPKRRRVLTQGDVGRALEDILEILQRAPAPAERYPSESETRLIELCEHMQFDLACYLSPKCEQYKNALAAIKRDLGIL